MLTSKDRMTIPLAPRRRIGWEMDGSSALLCILETNGSAELLRWDVGGSREMDEVASLLNRWQEPERTELALAAMDRYLKLTLDPDGRTVLPTSLLSHLDAIESGALRIVARNNRLWLWSEPRWRLSQPDRFVKLNEALRKPLT